MLDRHPSPGAYPVGGGEAGEVSDVAVRLTKAQGAWPLPWRRGCHCRGRRAQQGWAVRCGRCDGLEGVEGGVQGGIVAGGFVGSVDVGIAEAVVLYSYSTTTSEVPVLNSTMLGARRPVNGDTESPVVVDASRVCAALAGAVRMQCPSLVRAGKGPGVAAPPSTRVA